MSWQNQKESCKPLKKDLEDERLRRQCCGKIQHPTLESAEKEALRMTARYRQELVFNAYDCDFCGFHHIGRRFEKE